MLEVMTTLSAFLGPKYHRVHVVKLDLGLEVIMVSGSLLGPERPWGCEVRLDLEPEVLGHLVLFLIVFPLILSCPQTSKDSTSTTLFLPNYDWSYNYSRTLMFTSCGLLNKIMHSSDLILLGLCCYLYKYKASVHYPSTFLHNFQFIASRINSLSNLSIRGRQGQTSTPLFQVPKGLVRAHHQSSILRIYRCRLLVAS